MQTKTNPLLTEEITAVDRIRGHRFSPPLVALRKIPAMYATENIPEADKIVHLHFFTGSADWYVIEYDPDSGMAFGYADLGYGGEWGNIWLPELGAYQHAHRTVERDCWFDPTPVSGISGIKN